ncbi:MAG TPA: MiaB/RimO family radical SAM methylthiotransferase, partial [Candidatus Acidoferrum sp.]|nr:MiaB/RimO family radical SAM methylthiotransferase [Candidatus Acidoferrum sp.]
NQNASVVTTNNIESIAGVVKSAVLGQKQVINDYKKIDRLVFASPNSNVISKIAINDGCASSCLFCETKFARGPLNSFSEELIVKAVELSVERGAREIQLASQDTGAYGLDRATNIAKLMLKISKIAGDFKVRIGMLNPEHISKYLDSFIEIMKSEKFYKFVHLPVQSGSNDVLRHMRRMYTIEHFNEYVDRIRAEIPWITVETDIIVGYPAETEQDFEQTLGFVRESRPNIVNMSKFWSRPHTMASKLKQLSQETITERSAELGRVVRKVQKEINDSFVGTISNVLITETEESSFNGRTDNYKKVIIKKKDTDENVFIGNKVRVKIEKASCNVLYARLT